LTKFEQIWRGSSWALSKI